MPVIFREDLLYKYKVILAHGCKCHSSPKSTPSVRNFQSVLALIEPDQRLGFKKDNLKQFKSTILLNT